MQSQLLSTNTVMINVLQNQILAFPVQHM